MNVTVDDLNDHLRGTTAEIQAFITKAIGNVPPRHGEDTTEDHLDRLINLKEVRTCKFHHLN